MAQQARDEPIIISRSIWDHLGQLTTTVGGTDGGMGWNVRCCNSLKTEGV